MPKSKFYGTGHSLGAYLAQANAVNYNFENTVTYAAPNPNGHFTPDIQARVNKGMYDNKIKNIGHSNDMINRLNFFNTRIGKDVTMVPKYDKFSYKIPFIGEHFIDSYNNFDNKGVSKEANPKVNKKTKSEIAKAKALNEKFDPLLMLESDDDDVGPIKKEKLKKDKDNKVENGRKSKQKESKKVKEDTDSNVKKGKGESSNSGKK